MLLVGNILFFFCSESLFRSIKYTKTGANLTSNWLFFARFARFLKERMCRKKALTFVQYIQKNKKAFVYIKSAKTTYKCNYNLLYHSKVGKIKPNPVKFANIIYYFLFLKLGKYEQVNKCLHYEENIILSRNSVSLKTACRWELFY